MEIYNIKKHGENQPTYFGEIGNSKVLVVFENEALPVEGNIRVLLGKMITKNNQNYYYVSRYELGENQK